MLKPFGVLVVALTVAVSACSSSEEASQAPIESVDSTGSDTATDSVTATADAFCVEFETLQGERPESYVGSSEQLEDVEELLAVAPDPVADEVATFRDYLASGAIDSESDPDSNLTENWPDDVQSAIVGLQTYAVANC